MFEQIHQWLSQEGVAFRHLTHEPTLTSEESARVRGEALEIGGKALLLKIDQTFHLFVISAARKLDSKAIKKHFKAKKLRFATREELAELTGLVPGSVPPFGHPILPFDLYVDTSIMENERIAFNAGSLTQSVIMQVADYQKLAQPKVMLFSKADQN
ncbi:MAG: YbaK/EbsC family protein [Bacteroidota bacterium]